MLHWRLRGFGNLGLRVMRRALARLVQWLVGGVALCTRLVVAFLTVDKIVSNFSFLQNLIDASRESTQY